MAISAPLASASAAPRGYRGTISIHFDMRAAPGGRTGGKSDGHGTFTGVYHVHGRRDGGRYTLVGSGSERTKVFRIDTFNDTGVAQEWSLSAVARGSVHLVKRPNSARETSGPTLILRPHEKFKIALVGLDNTGTAGVPLSYRVDWKDTDDCVPPGGADIHTGVYDDGVLTEANPQVCPDSTSDPTQAFGTKKKETLWGANVWDSHARTPRPDVCRQRLSLGSNPSICGHLKRNGTIHGRAQVGQKGPVWENPGPCPFEPWGIGGLQDPFEDGISHLCSLGFEVNDPAWRQVLTIDYNLRPV